MTAIGFIGPGIMGAPMIANLVRAGFAVRAFGRSQRSRDRIQQAGAQVAESAADAAAEAQTVITMLPDTPDVQQVVLGDGGLGDALTEGQVLIDMSTIRPDVTRQIAAELAERGVAMLDAPVSGGEAGAMEGALSVMVGGETGVLERVRSVLEPLASSITHVGPSGAGQLTKAANQLIVAANIQAVAEAIVLLESAGADVQHALQAIGGGLAGSAVLDRKRHAFLSGDFTPGFRVELHNKDLRIVQDTAREAGVGLPVAAVVSQFMAAAEAQGHGELDHSVLLQVARDLNAASKR